MKKLVWVLVVVVLWLGCKQKVPNGIINRDKMEEILFDIHLVDGYISTIYMQDSARKVGAAYYNGIYKKYDTDSVQYTRSLTYYNNNPEILQEIYKGIAKKLENQKIKMQKADSLIQKKRFKADSIKIVKNFKADSLAIRKKMKTDSLSKVKADAQIKKKKAQADSLLNSKKGGELQVAPTLVQ